MKALLVSGGETPSQELIEKYIVDTDIIVAADRGLQVLQNYGVVPDILIGDMDSVTLDDFPDLDLNQLEMVKLNPIKDYSDTHYAIELLKNRGVTELVILGGLGLRMDHSLSNIFSMEHFMDDLEILMVDEHNRVTLFKEGNYLIPSDAHPYLSLFCLSNTCKFSIENTKYVVREFENIRANPIGLSNEILEGEASLNVHEGLVMVIQSKD